ncbi:MULTISPECIES: hypothetical protein [unclassified Micromonospora]|uniref:hypothetical protein n=1 Tax=unclassified Micromonospora TaxID=2617518 RepID=UPI003644EE5A
MNLQESSAHHLIAIDVTPDVTEKRRNEWTSVAVGVLRGVESVRGISGREGDLSALRRQFDDWPIDGLKKLAVVRPDGTIQQIIRQL